ncbi:hypothetical protein DSL72_004354 [Monilinia vaccinii-corymbosi]|uniref:Aminoglycoside phosphotransferase domain-containing protein n=1 Tax=Monilinia vaccinii-corymbosi TaxID=61207 RepID=A0A8A3P3M0_9HELO|nr:hypothetical protein DSL72_004354 [Monilinia vaccinii-corymbosi]
MATIGSILSKLVGPQKNMFPRPSTSENTKLIERLCTEMSFAKDIVYGAIKHGGNNNVLIFTCIPLAAKSQGQRICCILRTRKMYNFSEKQQYPIDQSVKMLVALTHRFGKLGVGLPIPAILAYDSTFENPIYSPYTIQETVEGTTLLRQYHEMNLSLLHPRGPTHNPRLLERRQLARQIAEFIARKESCALPGYGTIRNASDGRTDDPAVLAARFVLAVAKTRIAGRLIPITCHISRFIGELVHARLRKASSRDNGDGDGVDERRKARNLVSMWRNMSEKRRLTDQPAILWHPDFHPRNIMFESDAVRKKLTGVIDWDLCMALPRIMTRGPPTFLWNEESTTTLSKLESEAIQDAFDETIEKLVPGFLEDAYSTRGVLVRALGMYALFGVDYVHYHELSYEQLVQLYEVEFPGELGGYVTKGSIAVGKPPT